MTAKWDTFGEVQSNELHFCAMGYEIIRFCNEITVLLYLYPFLASSTTQRSKVLLKQHQIRQGIINPTFFLFLATGQAPRWSLSLHVKMTILRFKMFYTTSESASKHLKQLCSFHDSSDVTQLDSHFVARNLEIWFIRRVTLLGSRFLTSIFK